MNPKLIPLPNGTSPRERLRKAQIDVETSVYRVAVKETLSRFQSIAATVPSSVTKAQLFQQIKDAITAVQNQNQP